MKPVTHLTIEKHQEAARLLNQVQDNLDQLTRVVNRAPYSDRSLRIGKAIQELLIDPLNAGWDANRALHKGGLRHSPYQSVGYLAPGSSRFVRRMAGKADRR